MRYSPLKYGNELRVRIRANILKIEGRTPILRAIYFIQLLILSTGTHFQPQIPTYLDSRRHKFVMQKNILIEWGVYQYNVCCARFACMRPMLHMVKHVELNT